MRTRVTFSPSSPLHPQEIGPHLYCLAFAASSIRHTRSTPKSPMVPLDFAPARSSRQGAGSPRPSSVATKLQQLVNQRFCLVWRDADVAAKRERTFARVQHGL